MSSIHHIGQRATLPAWCGAGPAVQLVIHHADLLALPQVSLGLRPLGVADLIGQSVTNARLFESEHKARLVRPATIVKRIDAEPPVIAFGAAPARPAHGQIRVPHERAIGKDPAAGHVGPPNPCASGRGRSSARPCPARRNDASADLAGPAEQVEQGFAIPPAMALCSNRKLLGEAASISSTASLLLRNTFTPHGRVG